MSTYTDHAQRELDQATGAEMDRAPARLLTITPSDYRRAAVLLGELADESCLNSVKNDASRLADLFRGAAILSERAK